jgi:hypothetical protein
MKNLEQIIKLELKKVLNEQKVKNYMFFSNLEQIKRQCELLLSFDKQMIENLLENGHDWADDHITVAKEDIDQVFDFIMNEKEGGQQTDLNESCWDGYKQVGGKMKNGKMVPNCVPINEASSPAQQAAIAINMKKKGIKPKNESEKEMYEAMEIDESKNTPTNPKLWAASLAWARSRYDVCPSAYCNGAAAKHYKSKGGGWRKKTNESINESRKNDKVYHKTYTSAINTALEYAEKKGYTYDRDEVAREIGMGPRKPKDGDTNRFTISLKKDDKEQKKSLHIQVYGMKETYELNCYIN